MYEELATKETTETVETSDMQIQTCTDRLKETEGTRETIETRDTNVHECNVYGRTEGVE